MALFITCILIQICKLTKQGEAYASYLLRRSIVINGVLRLIAVTPFLLKANSIKIGIIMSTISFVSLNSNQLAGPNGTADTVVITVSDENGAGVSGQQVTLSATANAYFLDNPLVTDSKGHATACVFCDTAGEVTLSATLADGTTSSLVISFAAKPVTTTLPSLVPPMSISFSTLQANQPAGTSADIVVAKVVDSTGAVATNQSITWSGSAGATISTTTNPATTDSAGQATVYVFGANAGDITLTATLSDGTSASTVISFVEKTVTSSLTSSVPPYSISFNSLVSNQYADTTADVVVVRVKDSTGAVVPNLRVTFSADSGATFPTTTNPSVTDSLGEATVYVFSETASSVNLTATLDDATTASTVVTFIAKDSSASSDLSAFKLDVAAFISYIQQQISDAGQKVNSALTQLSDSVAITSYGKSDNAFVTFTTNDQTFNAYVTQCASGLSQNVQSAFAQLKAKYS